MSLIRLALDGMFASATPQDRECLAQLDFAEPRSLADRVTATLLRAALKASVATEAEQSAK